MPVVLHTCLLLIKEYPFFFRIHISWVVLVVMFLNILGKSGNGRQRCCAQVHCCGSVASEGPVHEILVISKNQTPHDTWNWMLSMKWKERLAEHYLIVLFSVVQTFISKPFTCPFLQSLWQEEEWVWASLDDHEEEKAPKRVCLNTSTVESSGKLLQNLNPVVLHLT